jgi:hypothetical protein
MADLDFDANQYEPNAAPEMVPPGEYDAIIVASTRKPSQSGNGDLMALELQIITPGKYQNRKLFDTLNMWNRSEQAMTIARSTFSSICRAVNVPSPRSSEEVHNKPLTIKVAAKKDQNGNLRAQIAAYKPRQAPAMSTATAPAAYNAAPAGKPW